MLKVNQAFHTVRIVLFIGCSGPVVQCLNKTVYAVNDSTTGPEHLIKRTMGTVWKA